MIAYRRANRPGAAVFGAGLLMLLALPASPVVREVHANRIRQIGRGTGVVVAAAGNLAVIGSESDDYFGGHAKLYDLASGAAIRAFEDTVWLGQGHGVGGFGAVVAIGGGHVAVTAPQDGRVYLFGIDGHLEHVLQGPTGPDDPECFGGFGATLAVDASSVVVGGACDGVRVYDTTTGATRWQAGLIPIYPRRFGAAVALAGSHVVVGSPGERTVYAFDATTGASEWIFGVTRAPWVANELGRALAADDNWVAVAGTYSSRGTPLVFLLDARTGARRRLYRGPATSEPASVFGFSLAIDRDFLVAGDPGRRDERGVAYVLSRRSGRVLRAFSPRADDAHTGVSVAIANHDVLVASPGRGGVHAIRMSRTR